MNKVNRSKGSSLVPRIKGGMSLGMDSSQNTSQNTSEVECYCKIERLVYKLNLPLSSVKVSIVVIIVGESIDSGRRTDTS